jgi:hypothetical protein
MEPMKAAIGLEKKERKGLSWPLKILIFVCSLGVLQFLILAVIIISHHRGR